MHVTSVRALAEESGEGLTSRAEAGTEVVAFCPTISGWIVLSSHDRISTQSQTFEVGQRESGRMN